jgi:hypothetical protein
VGGGIVLGTGFYYCFIILHILIDGDFFNAAFIAFIISFLNKNSNFANVFDYTCLIYFALTYYGNNLTKSYFLLG